MLPDSPTKSPRHLDARVLADTLPVLFSFLPPLCLLPKAIRQARIFPNNCCESVTKNKAWNILNRQMLVQVGRGSERPIIPHTVLIFPQQRGCKENTTAGRKAPLSGLDVLPSPF